MDAIERCQRALDGATRLVEVVGEADLGKATPCSEWDVRALIGHMTGVVRMFHAGLTGEPAESTDGSPLGAGELAVAYRAAAERLMAAWRAPGALEGTMKLPIGEPPRSMGIGIVTADQLIHSWDLARALGQSVALDAEVCGATLETMHGLMKPEFRGPGRAFGEELSCPPEASIQDRLLAFSGRQP